MIVDWAPINQLFNEESIVVKIKFWFFVCGIIYGFDRTKHLFVIDFQEYLVIC